MIRVLPVIFAIAVAVYCLVDCVQTDKHQVRYLPKAMWLFLILIPVVGPIAWLLTGRPRSRPSGPAARPTVPRAPSPPRAPDDDPAFLAKLDEQRRLAARDNEARLQKEPAETDEDPESQRDSGS